MKTKRHYGGLSDKEREVRKTKEQLSGFCCPEAVEALVNPAADGLALVPDFKSIGELRRFFNRVRDIRPELKPSQRGLMGGLGNARLPEPQEEGEVRKTEPLTLTEVSQVCSLDTSTPEGTKCIVCVALEMERPLILRRWRFVDEEGKLVWNEDNTPRVCGNFVERKDEKGELETRCYCGNPNDLKSHLMMGREIDCYDVVDGVAQPLRFRRPLPCFDYETIRARADARLAELQRRLQEEAEKAAAQQQLNERIEAAEAAKRNAETAAYVRAFRGTPRAKRFVSDLESVAFKE